MVSMLTLDKMLPVKIAGDIILADVQIQTR